MLTTTQNSNYFDFTLFVFIAKRIREKYFCAQMDGTHAFTLTDGLC